MWVTIPTRPLLLKNLATESNSPDMFGRTLSDTQMSDATSVATDYPSVQEIASQTERNRLIQFRRVQLYVGLISPCQKTENYISTFAFIDS